MRGICLLLLLMHLWGVGYWTVLRLQGVVLVRWMLLLRLLLLLLRWTVLCFLQHLLLLVHALLLPLLLRVWMMRV